MKFQQELLHQVYDDIQDLLKVHWEEIALNKDFIKLNPDWEQYEKAEQEGILKGFTAREDGKLVGYFVTIVQRSLHYSDYIFATNDVIFLHPEYRKGLAGWRLVKFAEKCLKEDGVSILFINTKVHKPFDALVTRMGYNLVERVYSKRLN